MTGSTATLFEGETIKIQPSPPVWEWDAKYVIKIANPVERISDIYFGEENDKIVFAPRDNALRFFEENSIQDVLEIRVPMEMDGSIQHRFLDQSGSYISTSRDESSITRFTIAAAIVDSNGDRTYTICHYQTGGSGRGFMHYYDFDNSITWNEQSTIGKDNLLKFEKVDPANPDDNEVYIRFANSGKYIGFSGTAMAIPVDDIGDFRIATFYW